jgi:hypothetical protein
MELRLRLKDGAVALRVPRPVALDALLGAIGAEASVPAECLHVRVGFPPRMLSAADLDDLTDGETLTVDWLETAVTPPAPPIAAAARGARQRRECCMYGAGCTRKNPKHAQQYAHPGDQDWQREKNDEASSVIDLTSTTGVAAAAAVKTEVQTESAGAAVLTAAAAPSAEAPAAPKRSWGGSGHVLATGTAVRPPRCYRKIVVVASFPWLGHGQIPPAHMTLLYWEGMPTPITGAHMSAVTDIVKHFDRPYVRSLDVDPAKSPPVGKSFLFDGEDVDPAGPIGQMIGAFGSIDPQLPHVNSCGQSGLGGLHVTGGLQSQFRTDFDLDGELLRRHPSGWARGRRGYELPLCLQMTAHVESLPENEALFDYVQASAGEAAATFISDSDIIITSAAQAVRSVRGVGQHGACARLIGEFFGSQQGSEGMAAAEAADSDAAAAEGPRIAAKKKRKTAEKPPIPGRGAGAHLVGEATLPGIGMHAAPQVEYTASGEGQGTAVRAAFYEFNTLHQFRGSGRVDKKLESLEQGSKRLRRLAAEPPGLRFLRFDDQELVLRAVGKPCWQDAVPTNVVEKLRRRHAAFWTFLSALQGAGLTKPVATAAVELNISGASNDLGLLSNLSASSDKLRFQPIPFAPAVYIAADRMLWGQLPPCPLCAGQTLVGSPSGWVCCKGWADKDADRPCVFQTDKRLQYHGGAGVGSVEGAGAAPVARQLQLRIAGVDGGASEGTAVATAADVKVQGGDSHWLFAEDVKKKLRGWTSLLPDDIADLRKQV